MTYQNKRMGSILIGATALLAVPAIAMIFTSEVKWTSSDFIIAAVLLFGTGLVIEVVLRKVKSKTSRIIFCAGILLILLLVWAELAVGIFGTPLAGN